MTKKSDMVNFIFKINPNFNMLISTCDEHNVAFATNEATKQLLLNDLAVD